MKLFGEDGHLTDEGLRALIAGELDEMGRLETAEHLDFCDQCVERYSELLTEEVELTPPEEAAPSVMERIRKRGRLIFVNRFVRVSVVAALTLILWGGFERIGLFVPTDQHAENMSEATRYVSGKFSGWNNALDELLSGFNVFLNTPRSERTDANKNETAGAPAGER